MGTLVVATALPRDGWVVHEMQMAVVARVAGAAAPAPFRGGYRPCAELAQPPDAFGGRKCDLRFCAGDPAVLFELVLEDLPVERAAADLQQAGRFLLVPRHRFEHPLDVGALGVTQRGQPR